MSGCDHRIGQYEEPGGCVDVRVSDRAATIDRYRAFWDKRAKQYYEAWRGPNPFFEKRRAMSDDELFAAHVAAFRFCPDCGERLLP